MLFLCVSNAIVIKNAMKKSVSGIRNVKFFITSFIFILIIFLIIMQKKYYLIYIRK